MEKKKVKVGKAGGAARCTCLFIPQSQSLLSSASGQNKAEPWRTDVFECTQAAIELHNCSGCVPQFCSGTSWDKTSMAVLGRPQGRLGD